MVNIREGNYKQGITSTTQAAAAAAVSHSSLFLSLLNSTEKWIRAYKCASEPAGVFFSSSVLSGCALRPSLYLHPARAPTGRKSNRACVCACVCAFSRPFARAVLKCVNAYVCLCVCMLVYESKRKLQTSRRREEDDDKGCRVFQWPHKKCLGRVWERCIKR